LRTSCTCKFIWPTTDEHKRHQPFSPDDSDMIQLGTDEENKAVLSDVAKKEELKKR
jgi:hypothetical protein